MENSRIMAVLETFQVFHGEVHPARARIYVRLARPASGQWRLSGRVTGPHNAFASTLPATVSLRDLGPGPTLLAEAIVPDPCFWSPDSPALYDVEVALVDETGMERQTASQTIGIRSFGVRGANFYLEGKRWVLRGADGSFDPDAAAAEWREAWCSPLAVSRDDAFLEDATRLGVLTVAIVAGTGAEVETELRRLSRWAAAAIAVVDCSEPLGASIASAAPNLLLGCHVGRSGSPIPAWASVLFAEAKAPKEFAQQFAATDRPVVAMRRLEGPERLSDARAACDVLQRDLAPYGDFAGYLVYRRPWDSTWKTYG